MFQKSTIDNKMLSPLVYWAQTESCVTLKVDLKEVKPKVIDITEKRIVFVANGFGARGNHDYSFTIDFYESILNKECTYKILDSKVDFTIAKSENKWWPRVQRHQQKPHWLKIDFDRWQSEDELAEPIIDAEDSDAVMQHSIFDDYPEALEALQKTEIGFRKEQAKKVYLILYNTFQFIGYFYVLLVMLLRYQSDGINSMLDTYANVGNAMKLCQLFQYLEPMHPLFKYTKGSVFMPFMQVTARNFILFVMIECEERMQTKPVVFYLFIVWSLIEVVRYPFYLSQLLDFNLSILTWLRYTLWIPLYPLGILCEGVIILRNIPYFEETNRFTIEMPNKWNFTFDMPTFMKIYLLILILPGTYFMMNHMAKTRKNKIGVGAGIKRKLSID